MKHAFGIFLFLIFIGCSSSKKLSHSFFVAGHAYGNPYAKIKAEKEGGNELKGLHPPFKEKFEFLRAQKKMTKGFLLGDVVWRPRDWPQTLEEIESLGFPIEVVRGNHEGSLKSYKKRFGESFRKYVFKNNLYIILDPNIDSWNISGDQLVFLLNTLRNDTKTIDNIFIFTHQILWYTNNKFSKPFPNSVKGRAKQTNFWSKIEPLLKKQKQPVYIFAGDVGASSKERRKKNHIIEYYYHSYDNITFIATGMGGGVRDNVVVVDVFNDGSVKFRLIHLNGNDVNGLGKLEDYDDPNFN